jgi:serine protease AprX
MVFKTKAASLLLLAAGSVAALTGSYYAVRSSSVAAPQQAQSVLSPTALIADSQVALAAKTHLAEIDLGLLKDMQKAGSGGLLGVFVHFSGENKEQQNALISRHKLALLSDFRKYTAAATDPSVYRLEWNEPLKLYNHTANWAIRTRVAQERVQDGPYFDAGGNILDGRGVGVAVIDSGVDGTHPDFAEALNGGRNYKATCAPVLQPCAGQFVDVGTTGTSDTSSGHGHHVSGTVLGSGAASLANYTDNASKPVVTGSFAGVAPKSKLYAYGTGEAISVLFAAQSYQHLLDNFENRVMFPTPIRVTNNSYGNAGGTAYTATNTLSQLVKRIVTEKQVVVVFAAGNDGDGTTVDTTSGYCKDPTPGVICVASYDDLGTGSRNGVFSDFTSQGAIGSPANYPDIAAPGTNILSACTAGLPICKDTGGGDRAYQPFYGTISGTSMASPHVTGAIALLLQARPNLTPKEVEEVLQNTALKVADNTYGANQAAYVPDPQNTNATTNYRAGAGLLDFPAALDRLGVTKQGTLPALAETTLIGGDGNVAGGADSGSATITGAADILKLSVLEETKAGVAGITYKLNVANATSLGAATYVRYQVLANIDGKAYTTTVRLTAGAVAAEGKGAQTNAPATSAALAGNVVSFFVPLANLGSPPVGAPMYNVRVNSRSNAAGPEAEVDYAPSRNRPGDTQETAPAWGKPYTILTASSPLVENRCEVPGLSLLNDNGGDSTTSSSQDLLSLSIAQPHAAAGNPNIVFTIKVSDLNTLTAGSGYFVSFNTPEGVRGVRMQVVNPTAPEFFVYVPGANQAGTVDGRFVDSQVPAAAGSNYNAATGTITIVATPASLNLPSVGMQLSGFNGGVTQSSDAANAGVGGFTLVTDEMPDGLGRAGSFTYVANRVCAPNVAPVARLTVNKASAGKDETFIFSGLTSTDANDDLISEYTFDFGDTSLPQTNATGTAERKFARSGNYTVTLKVRDERGLQSGVVSTVVNVNNAVPTVELSSNLSEAAAPATIDFTARGLDNDPSDVAGLRYSFDLDGDGTFEIVDTSDATQSRSYEAPGTYTASVKVVDSEGAQSVDTLVITIVEATNTFAGVSFVERFNVPQRSVVTSERVVVSGFSGNLDVVPGSGTLFSIDNGPFTNQPQVIRSGQSLAVRHTSASTDAGVVETTITVGGRLAKLRSTTTTLDRDPEDLVNFTTLNNVAPGALAESNVQTPVAYDDAPISVTSGAEYRLNGGAWTRATGRARKGDTVQVRHLANNQSLGYTRSTLRIGARTVTFISRTRK